MCHLFMKRHEGHHSGVDLKACFSLQGNCRVMRVKDGTANTSMQKSAMDFIQARLYGPGTQRTTSKETQHASVQVFNGTLHPETH